MTTTDAVRGDAVGSDCEGGWVGHFFGHRFEAVYDEARAFPKGVYPKSAQPVEFTGWGWTVEEMVRAQTGPIEALKETRRTYRGHVCRRCGARTFAAECVAPNPPAVRSEEREG